MTKRALIAPRGDDMVATNMFANLTELAASLHPDVAALAVEVPSSVQVGWIRQGDTWSAPPPLPPIPPPED